MSKLVCGDTVYVTVWTDSNCGPGYRSEITGTLVDLDYVPTDADREYDQDDYLTRPGPFVLVVPPRALPMIVALNDIRIRPTPR